MADIADVDQDYKLWVLLHQTSGMIFEARENAVREYDITTMQAEVLFAIQAIGGEATPAQVSRWILRRPHTVTGTLQRMEKMGWVKKNEGFAQEEHGKTHND